MYQSACKNISAVESPGFPSPTITWSKLRAPLPWRHKVVNNSLVLPSVGRQDSGEYICSATNNMGTSDVTIMLDVESECRPRALSLNLQKPPVLLFITSKPCQPSPPAAPPYATSVPDDVAVRVGEVIRLQCLAHGTPPLTYTWTKLDGALPPRAQVNGGDLQINLATAEDAGSYKCVSTNKVGISEVTAKVTVRCESCWERRRWESTGSSSGDHESLGNALCASTLQPPWRCV